MPDYLSVTHTCDHCDEPITGPTDRGYRTFDRNGRSTVMHIGCLLSAIGWGTLDHAVVLDDAGCMMEAANAWRPLVEYYVAVNRLLKPGFSPSPTHLAKLIHLHFHHESSYGLYLACLRYGS